VQSALVALAAMLASDTQDVIVEHVCDKEEDHGVVKCPPERKLGVVEKGEHEVVEFVEEEVDYRRSDEEQERAQNLHRDVHDHRGVIHHEIDAEAELRVDTILDCALACHCE